MYNPLTEEEIKNNIRSIFSHIENKSVVELAIDCLINTEIKTIGDLSEKEVDVLRERYGINEYNTPKTLKQIGEKYDLTAERIRAIEAKAQRKLGRKIINYNSTFMVNELKLSDNAKEFLFSAFANYNDFHIFLNSIPNSNEPNVSREIRDAFNNLTKKEIANFITSNIPIEACDFSVRTYNCLKRAGIDTVKDLIIFKFENRISNIRNLGRNSYTEIENYLASLKMVDIDKQNTIEENTVDNQSNPENLSIESVVEKQQEETIDTEIQLKTEHDIIVATQTEDLSIEDALEKQQEDNSLIRERIKKKEELLKKYKKVSDEKAELLEKEKELDDELKIIMEKIKGSYMENKNDRTKK